MHQPDYRDANGIIQMPWVFLHAIKDYYDMPWMVASYPGMKATFNITSPLIEQLKLYYHLPHERDKFIALWLKEPSHLNEDERQWIIKLCKSTQFETMVTPFARYIELYQQEQHYNDSELIDLEILFMLSWCGVYLRKNSDIVKNLIAKQREYSSEDKSILLQELSHFVMEIFPYYQELSQEGVISLSTTPLNHPILPLLLDMNNAQKANINTNIPKEPIPLIDDAKMQIEQAKQLFEETFGFVPTGFWPAEGAVDTKSVALLKEAGIRWIATDEEILFKSLNSHDRNKLYHPYDYNDMCIGFRDHYLSDLIGFSYRHQNPQDATKHFIHELKKIEDNNSKDTVFVILDGENAWEFYENNGYDFFNNFYSAFNDLSWCQTLTMDEVYQLDREKMSYLAPGSWIHGSFDTWVGHNEKTRAWELIYLTKREYERHKLNLDDTTKQKIQEHFLAAECSDWFWWYGDDHYTEFGAEFDELFRSHLVNIYDLMQVTPHADIFVPIIKDKSVEAFWLRPQSDISPDINGKHDSFFEWIGCGVIDESKLFSTMDRARGPVNKIYYGQDDEKIYFGFEANTNILCPRSSMRIIIEPINVNGRISFENQKTFFGDLEVHVACESFLEISIDKKFIEVDNISILFEIEEDEKIVQTLPGFGELKIDLGNDYSQNWFI